MPREIVTSQDKDEYVSKKMGNDKSDYPSIKEIEGNIEGRKLFKVFHPEIGNETFREQEKAKKFHEGLKKAKDKKKYHAEWQKESDKKVSDSVSGMIQRSPFKYS